MNLKVLVIVLAFCVSLTAQTVNKSRKMALTFDDLPFVSGGRGEYLPNARRATAKILQTLKAHRALSVGFVNEGQLHITGQVEARIALLQDWVDAGMTLGNHTYSHPDFNAVSVQKFQDEIVRGDVITRRLMNSRQPYQLYFRHPMTHTGDTKAKKDAIEAFLTARGYRVTPHTIENSDFVFNVGYVRALDNKDQATALKLRNAYLQYTLAATEFAEKISPRIFDREIAQTLLLHANDITADCLDEMLKRFATFGYKFVTLDEAMADPAYQTPDTNVSRLGPTWLSRWMKSKGMNISFAADPEPPEWVMDLYRQR